MLAGQIGSPSRSSKSEAGARGRSCTCTGDVLDVVPLHWATRAVRSAKEWSLQPVLLRQEFFTKEIRRLLHGGKMVAIPSAAPAQLAYETYLSAGSTAVPSPGIAPG